MRTCESCLRDLCGLAPLREVLVLITAAQSVFFVTWFRCGSKSSTTEERRNTEELLHRFVGTISVNSVAILLRYLVTKGLLVVLNHKGTKEQSEGSNDEAREPVNPV